MSHVSRFILRPELPAPDVDLLARHIAMDLLPAATLCDHLSITAGELARLSDDADFRARVARERRRLLSLEGQREVLDWKQALTEGQYWDRLMKLAMNEQASATAIIDGMKVTKRPQERGQGVGGAGGPQFVVQINVPGATTTVVAAQPPVIEGSAG